MLQDLYNDTFSLYSYGQTGRNDIGGVEKTAILRQANISCYATEIDEDTYYEYGKDTVKATHRLFCDLLSTIYSSDKIYLTGPSLWADILFIDNCNSMDDHMELALLTIKAPEVVA